MICKLTEGIYFTQPILKLEPIFGTSGNPFCDFKTAKVCTFNSFYPTPHLFIFYFYFYLFQDIQDLT